MKNKLIQHLKKNLPSNVEINVDTPLLEDNILDSLGIIDLIYFIEDLCSVTIPDEEFNINNFKDINSIIQLIQRIQ